MDAFISFRPLIQEKLAPFSSRFGENAELVSQLLLECIVNVSNFREEGHPLAPVVFVTTDLSRLLAIVHGEGPILVGAGPADSQTARIALRSCIPLGEGRQWAVYLQLTGGQLEYGVFCTDRSPLRVTSFEALRWSREALEIVGITRLGENLVEVCGGQGLQQYLDFSATADLAMHQGRTIREFVKAVTKDVDPELRGQFEAFFYRIGVEIFSGAKGFLVAVLAPGVTAPQFLSDGIWLKEPMDIHVRSHRATDFLVAQSDLMRRMMTMDGMAVFNSSGNLLAYNCFIREQSVSVAPRNVSGGARRRAYEIMVSHVGRALQAAFYRSQDGFGEWRAAR